MAPDSKEEENLVTKKAFSKSFGQRIKGAQKRNLMNVQF